MASLKNWINAFRPRTLFLAVSAVTLGSGLALYNESFSFSTFILALLLAISMQILSNLANDLGDFLKGTDITGKRQGPKRTMQSGVISLNEMKRAIFIIAFATAVIGLILVIKSVSIADIQSIIIMLTLGVLCILAALLYTLGRKAYGYSGLGDLFAFLFFGPVAVTGTYFLHTNSLRHDTFLPAIGLGLISAMVLNVNNMRDIDNDIASGKKTFATHLGLRGAKIYHLIMTLSVILCFLLYTFNLPSAPWYRFGYVVLFIFLIKNMQEIKSKKDKDLDPYLRLTSIYGFLIALSFSILLNV